MSARIPLGSALLRLAISYLALAALLSLGLGWDWIQQNGYLDHGLDSLAWTQWRDRLQRDLLRAGVVLVLLAVTLAPLGWCLRWRRGLLAAGGAVALASLPFLGSLSSAGNAVTDRAGIALPSELWWSIRLVELRRGWPSWWLWVLGALVVTLAAIVVIGWRRRGRTPLALNAHPGWLWIPAVLLALVVTAVHVGAWMHRPAPAGADGTQHVVFVTWDSLRADGLSIYGNPRPTSPHLDAFAQTAVVFDDATSQHNWTRPSYGTMLTSLFHWEMKERFLTLPEVTLAETLKNQGFSTNGFVQNPQLDPHHHFDQGFDLYHHVYHQPSPRHINRLVEERLQTLDGERIFLFIHYLRPHYPYPADDEWVQEFTQRGETPLSENEVMSVFADHGNDWDPDAPGAEQELEHLRNLYEGTIRSTDTAFSELQEILGRHLDLDQTLFIFNSDHGDEFYEHGSFGHALPNLHPELIHTPLIIRFPRPFGIEPRRVSQAVMNLDVMPTILDVLDIEPTVSPSGQSLLPLLRGETPAKRLIFSSFGQLLAIRDQRYKLICDFRDGGPDRFYDRQTDPRETSPLEEIDDHPVYRAMRDVATAWYADQDPDAEVNTSATDNEALRAQLEALGYVGEKR